MFTQYIIEAINEYKEGFGRVLNYLNELEKIDVGTTPADVIYTGRKMRLLHYKPTKDKLYPTPLLIVYALINRYYILDLQPDRSWVKKLVDEGFDVYMIDWGTPMPLDKHLTYYDYVNRYIDRMVEIVRNNSSAEKISLQGYCMGGFMSVLYTSLYQEKIKNLLTIAPVIDTEKDTTVLGNTSKHLDVDALIDTYGNCPPEFLYVCYSLLKPFKQGMLKYMNFTKNENNKAYVDNFLRVEKWLFDTPPIAGDTFKQWIKDVYQSNLLVKNRLMLEDQHIDLRNINVPLYNIAAADDHLVSPECSIPLNYHVSSVDEYFKVYPTGHIGLIASSYSQKIVLRDMIEWLKVRSI
ncbi:MAG: class III poly(R)-hydroxyalkanoic acid synthase subunit PhaC [Candidatus Nitrosocaldaceae archaeon]